jgi:hypothetical protein
MILIDPQIDEKHHILANFLSIFTLRESEINVVMLSVVAPLEIKTSLGINKTRQLIPGTGTAMFRVIGPN